MTDTPAASEPGEAYQVLLARVGRRAGKVPADLLVRHVLAVVPADEWPVRVEALDAVLRRLESARRDGLRLQARPAGGAALGPYATGRKGGAARPYRTVLAAVDPIDGRCDCPDFLKNSLGLCKHVLAVLDHLHARPRLLQRALKEQAERAAAGPVPALRWDPIRPLTGPGDWLDRVSLIEPSDGPGRPPARWGRLGEWFRPGRDGERVVRNAFPQNPAKRLALVEGLLKAAAGASAAPADPALHALLLRERDRLARRTRQAVSPAEARAALKKLRRSLYPYQREGVARFLAEGRLLLADDMGLGKTAQAIAACDALWRSRRIRRGLIIAPASLKPQWAREWAAFSDLPIRVVEGAPAERRAGYEATRSGLLIINYEQLIRDLDVIRRWEPDLVVLDEAQRIKNWATKTALSVKGLAPPYRLVLTGTPMENRIDELASIVEWVDELALEPKWRLASLHAVQADGRREVVGVRHLDTIRRRLAGCMLRRVRREVLDQLPPRTDTRVPVELTDEQQGEHDALIPPIAALVQRAKSRPLTQPEFLRLMSLLTTQRIIANGLAQLRFAEVWPAIRRCAPEDSVIRGLSAPKLLELRQLVRQLALDQGRKVVVFSQWRRMLTLAHWAVGDLLAGGGLRAGFFTGAEGQKRRTRNIVEFHDDPGFRLLFASDAGGVGLNLQRASNCVINLELPWNPAVLEQRIGRVYRLGQDQPIDVFNLVSEPGIEARIAGLVGSKQAFFTGLFDGSSDAVRFEQSGSFLARVEKLYGPGGAPRPAPAGSAEAEDPEAFDPAETGPDDEVEDAFGTLVEAADESRDGPLDGPAAAGPAPADAEEAPAGDGRGRRPMPAAGEVRRLFSRLQIRRQDDGRVVIEAPPEAATALGELFEGMAALLRAASDPP